MFLDSLLQHINFWHAVFPNFAPYVSTSNKGAAY
jgi:hypothetical protein